MTPAARIAAAAELLDAILAGAPAEQILTRWARASRFAGSKDRLAVRDLVFEALRRRRSCAALGGTETGRGLMLGLVRARGEDPDTLFTGSGHAPAPLTGAERAVAAGDLPEEVALDVPDWLAPRLRASLGADFAAVMALLRDRAPVFVRVNLAKADRAAAQAALAEDGIAARPHPLSPTALELTENARKLHLGRAYRDGLVEVQDAASQAVCDHLPVPAAGTALDYCAGGGGKALALAARPGVRVFAHDAEAQRMRDLPARAGRSGVRIDCLAPGAAGQAAPYDLVLCDAPCSGSGAWRRSPDGKWRLTEARLAELVRIQATILDAAAPLVAPGGVLAYATCSLLDEENAAQATRFCARSAGWQCRAEHRFTPLDGGDGFYLALLERSGTGLTRA
ncbi:16S rRNA (cytosine967-C5)-methyltransferase [Rhodovulum iodosum]|uniref:16S rRNA (Cytosine967-C5)-methyltransferase n=1 Tax=Rhodovulum iodosum TaxID=68291 RepID=A0ABV3XU31_9RHOB|nr:RsmB/NOP family class I SAM-dependent RNA methyltransferase [Rhodovulum robiginosum]RSK32268.1 RsmB/NOP family class I SAM-dependent RNA methyltransferase [Rhodovulum robiginosum]